MGTLGCTRLWGETAYETSLAIARRCAQEGMSLAKVGAATGEDYYDALAGAALCGKLGSPIILVSDHNRATIDGFIVPNKSTIGGGYAFGGQAAVSNATLGKLGDALE